MPRHSCRPCRPPHRRNSAGGTDRILATALLAGALCAGAIPALAESAPGWLKHIIGRSDRSERPRRARRAAPSPNGPTKRVNPSRLLPDRRGVGSEDRKTELLFQARRQYAAGELDRAKRTVRALLKWDPDCTEARQLQAEIALDQGDLAAYAQMLRTIIATHPDSAPLLHDAGTRLAIASALVAGAPSSTQAIALDALRRAAELVPHKSQYVCDLASALVGQADLDEAQKVLRKALGQRPHDRQLLLAAAYLSEFTGQWDEARRYYSLALQQAPDDWRTLRARGRCAYRAGHYIQAQNDFRRCLEQAADQLSAADYVEFGDACLRLKDYVLAQAAFDALSQLERSPIREVEVLRSLCALRRGYRIQARGILTQALTYWPEDPVLEKALALCDRSSSEPAKDKGAVLLVRHSEEAEAPRAKPSDASSSDAAPETGEATVQTRSPNAPGIAAP